MPRDAELLARWRDGDALAFEALYAEVSPGLSAYCRMLTGSEGAASDLFQETWARAMTRAESFREQRSAKGWLLSIAHHLWIDEWRRKKVERRILDLKSKDLREEARDEGSDLDLATALKGLSPEHRSLILLYDLQGLTIRETAETLGLSRSTAQERLFKARRALAGALGIRDQSGQEKGPERWPEGRAR